MYVFLIGKLPYVYDSAERERKSARLLFDILTKIVHFGRTYFLVILYVYPSFL